MASLTPSSSGEGGEGPSKRVSHQQIRDSQRDRMHQLVQGLAKSVKGPPDAAALLQLEKSWSEFDEDNLPAPEGEPKRRATTTSAIQEQPQSQAAARRNTTTATATARGGGANGNNNNLRFFPTKGGGMTAETLERRVAPSSFLLGAPSTNAAASSSNLGDSDASSSRRVSQTPFQRAESAAQAAMHTSSKPESRVGAFHSVVSASQDPSQQKENGGSSDKTKEDPVASEKGHILSKTAGTIPVSPGKSQLADPLQAPLDKYNATNTIPQQPQGGGGGLFQAVMMATSDDDPARSKLANNNNEKGPGTLAQKAGAVPVTDRQQQQPRGGSSP